MDAVIADHREGLRVTQPRANLSDSVPSSPLMGQGQVIPESPSTMQGLGLEIRIRDPWARLPGSESSCCVPQPPHLESGDDRGHDRTGSNGDSSNLISVPEIEAGT